MTKQLKADFGLLFITLGWGASFILTKNALNHLATFNFLAIRFVLAFALASLIYYKRMLKLDKKTIKLGIGLGVILYLHYVTQTIGLNYTTSSKSAFITGTNVVMVPIFSAMILKKFPEKKIILGVILAFIGLILLTLNDVSGANIGDFYTLLCAIIFAIYIIAVEKYTNEVDSIAFAIVQLGVVAFLSLITTYTFEVPIIPTNTEAWVSIGILVVVCTCGAYIIQSIALNHTTSTHAALIYAGEPVFAAIFAFVLYNEMLSTKGLIGGALILLGMVVSELKLEWFEKINVRE